VSFHPISVGAPSSASVAAGTADSGTRPGLLSALGFWSGWHPSDGALGHKFAAQPSRRIEPEQRRGVREGSATFLASLPTFEKKASPGCSGPGEVSHYSDGHRGRWPSSSWVGAITYAIVMPQSRDLFLGERVSGTNPSSCRICNKVLDIIPIPGGRMRPHRNGNIYNDRVQDWNRPV